MKKVHILWYGSARKEVLKWIMIKRKRFIPLEEGKRSFPNRFPINDWCFFLEIVEKVSFKLTHAKHASSLRLNILHMKLNWGWRSLWTAQRKKKEQKVNEKEFISFLFLPAPMSPKTCYCCSSCCCSCGESSKKCW